MASLLKRLRRSHAQAEHAAERRERVATFDSPRENDLRTKGDVRSAAAGSGRELEECVGADWPLPTSSNHAIATKYNAARMGHGASSSTRDTESRQVPKGGVGNGVVEANDSFVYSRPSASQEV